MVTNFTRENWVSQIKHWWFVLAVICAVVAVGVVVGIRSVVLNNHAAEDDFQAETEALKSLTVEDTASSASNTPGASEEKGDVSSDSSRLTFGVSNKDSYDTSMSRRTSIVDRVNRVVGLAMNWDSSKVYSANRAKIIDLGVPENSQLLKEAMPLVASNTIDGVTYDEIDLYKLTQSVSIPESLAGVVHVFSVDKKLVAITTADVRPKDSYDASNVSHVLVRLVFDEQGKDIVDAYIGILSQATLVVPSEDKTGYMDLTANERNGGPVEN